MVSGYSDAGQEKWLADRGIALIRGVGRLAGPGRVFAAQKQADVLGVRAEVVFIGEQVVERLDVVLGVLARLDRFVGVVADADQDDIGLRALGLFRARRQDDEQTQDATRQDAS